MTTDEIKSLYDQYGRQTWTRFIPFIREILHVAPLSRLTATVASRAAAKAFKLGFMAGAAVATKKEEMDKPRIITPN
jgi:hypothetical protein